MDRSVCIVGGCGHIGLPLGLVLANAGARVTLLDTSADRVESVAAGRMPFFERGADEELAVALEGGRLEATTDPDAVGRVGTVIVTIGTPVDEFLSPAIRAFDRAMEPILDRMRDGQLLILRSTVFPGVTERLARRARERGLRIDVAHCPERIAQGFALEEMGGLPQIIGGVTPTASGRASSLFGLLGVRRIELPPVEAELCKLFCNSYRYINFAISNQFYVIAERFGADFERIRGAMMADYPRMSGFPGAGFAGGPCLLKDTMQLAAFNHNDFVLGQAAMMINEGLPRALVEPLKSRYDLSTATAAILGMAFKGNNDDPRDSLAYKLRKVLTFECRRVLCTDPYIQDPSFVPLETALEEADVVFLGACHEEYRDLVIRKPTVDVFHFLRKETGDSEGLAAA
ncbi:UDP-N-acetyl-D-glucosamine 6-dehydrogenase [Aquisphaera giovannonii]|uniref:UDP-N-acetyl-D-glucosamine 6-dehydrogenase n=1 Tax=Aquisphaera giovannonii TaxID=406548 RepID=A0A5B9W7I6_9BACT|nr:nucleotide sugar dehydrogenase [Aquisphaera giovannonii]QEH36652.1 UDP-N-acetyl-D-glucosamine 6-dehydrogenase [Aquisphaera giovannonii]